ncbi:MAG: TIGR00282 family metallophosphoesterase, partial [Bacillota bacterium]
RAGRNAVRALLPSLRRDLHVDFVIANAENAAGGTGITPQVGDELLAMGVDVLTLGNHTWDKREAFEYIGVEPRVLRPLNYPGHPPGRGSGVFMAGGLRVGVVSVCGRVFSPTHFDCPFRALDGEVANLTGKCDAIIVDAHGEATSEKQAIGRYLDGRVAAVVGTHTHVATCDAAVLPQGTGYITDVGMTGPVDSIIGVKTELALERFLTQMPVRLEPATGPARLSAALISAEQGLCTGLELVQRAVV